MSHTSLHNSSPNPIKCRQTAAWHLSLANFCFFPFKVKTVRLCSVSPGLVAYQACMRTHNESALAACVAPGNFRNCNNLHSIIPIQSAATPRSTACSQSIRHTAWSTQGMPIIGDTVAPFLMMCWMRSCLDRLSLRHAAALPMCCGRATFKGLWRKSLATVRRCRPAFAFEHADTHRCGHKYCASDPPTSAGLMLHLQQQPSFSFHIGNLNVIFQHAQSALI